MWNCFFIWLASNLQMLGLIASSLQFFFNFFGVCLLFLAWCLINSGFYSIFICHLKYYLLSLIMFFFYVVTNVSLFPPSHPPQIGKKRKKANVDLLKERKRKIQEAKKSKETWSAPWICMAWICCWIICHICLEC